MSDILTGAYLILSESSSPLTAKQITEELLKRKLWSTTGKTPDATVGAAIYVNIKKLKDNALFKKVGKNLFTTASNSIVPAEIKKTPTPKKKTPTKRGRKVAVPAHVETQTFSYLDCAEKVLQTDANRKPMHYSLITKLALKYGWLVSSGLTPEASMSAQLYTDIKKCEAQGRRSRFTMEKGLVGLTEWSVSSLERQIEQHNEEQRKKLLEKVKALSPSDFEKLITTLLPLMGFSSAEQTQLSGDHGVDVRGTLVVHESINIRLAVQAKRWQENVPAPVVQALRGSLRTDERGLIVTTSKYTDGAKAEAARTDAHAPIDLIDGKQLVDLLVAYDLGVSKNKYQLLEIKDSFFDESPNNDK